MNGLRGSDKQSDFEWCSWYSIVLVVFGDGKYFQQTGQK